MAFTSQGMFYLSEKDLEPTIGLAGTGVRGMLGLQNKKEAVDSIMQSGDFSTPESRRGILEQIRAVDPTAYQKYAKENQDWETKEYGLKEKRNVGKLNKAWIHGGRLQALQLFAEQHLGIDTNKSSLINNDTDLLNLIRSYASDDEGDIDKGLVTDLNSIKTNFLKSTKDAYFKQHALTDFDSYKDLDLKGLPTSDSVIDKPNLLTDTTQTHLEEQNPQSSKAGLQWEQNKRTSEIDALGSGIKPGAVLDYNTGSVSRMPGVDATFGNVQDAVTSSVNSISSSLADFGNLFTGTVAGDKQRNIAEEASDWYISRAGHNHFAGNPKELDKILSSKNRNKAALAYYKKQKAKKKK